MNISDARQAILAYLQSDTPVFLWGAPGVGKSDIVASIADDLGYGLVDERLTTLEAVDLRGLPLHRDGAVHWARPVMFETIRGFGDRPSILFLDELVNASQSMQAATYQLILNRRIGPHVLPPHVRIVAAGNRQSDRAAANRMPSALANRFAHLDVEADAKTWRAWAEASGLHPMVSAYIGFRPDNLHDMRDANARAFPTPRSWAAVARVITQAPREIWHTLVAGMVGASFATDFMAFVETFSRVPKLADILRDPKNCPVPSMAEPGLLYATAVQISRGMTRANIGPLIVYLERMPADIALMAVYDATNKDNERKKSDPTAFQGLMQTGAFIAWASRNSDMSVGGDR